MKIDLNIEFDDDKNLIGEEVQLMRLEQVTD